MSLSSQLVFQCFVTELMKRLTENYECESMNSQKKHVRLSYTSKGLSLKKLGFLGGLRITGCGNFPILCFDSFQQTLDYKHITASALFVRSNVARISERT